MLRRLHLLIGFVLLVSCSREPEHLTYRVVETRTHDPECYTQGLEFSGNRLFESGGGYGTSTIREVDPESGKVLRSRSFPAQVFAEGITIFDNELFVLTWLENTVFVLNPDTFDLIRTHKYEGEGWGLTHNGKELIMSNGSSSLSFLDPKTFQVKRTLKVTDGDRGIDMLNELEFSEGTILANIYLKENIARINAETGAVVSWIDLSGLRSRLTKPNQADVLNGIALVPGSDRLLVTGKLWPNMFEIELEE